METYAESIFEHLNGIEKKWSKARKVWENYEHDETIECPYSFEELQSVHMAETKAAKKKRKSDGKEKTVGKKKKAVEYESI